MQFGDIHSVSPVKFHTVSPDIELLLNKDKLESMMKTIKFLEAKGGLLIFLDTTNEKNENMKDFGIGAQILNKIGIKEIKLLTSGGKHSFVGLTGFGLEIKEEIIID